jgi:hypothetical protein
MGCKSSRDSNYNSQPSDCHLQSKKDEEPLPPPPPYSFWSPNRNTSFNVFTFVERINMDRFVLVHKRENLQKVVRDEMSILPVSIDLYANGKRFVQEEHNAADNDSFHKNFQVVTSAWQEGRTLSVSFGGGSHTLNFECKTIVYNDVRVLAAKICLKDLIQCRKVLPHHILQSCPLSINYTYEMYNGVIRVKDYWDNEQIWKQDSKHKLESHCTVTYDSHLCYVMLDPTVLISFTDTTKIQREEQQRQPVKFF